MYEFEMWAFYTHTQMSTRFSPRPSTFGYVSTMYGLRVVAETVDASQKL